MRKHYTIPFFILHKGCPHQCVFCDQKKITGRSMIDPGEIPERIEQYLSTMPISGAHVEVGFFGGTFTGLSRRLQDDLLTPVRKYLDSGQVHGIRLSTRPDFIDKDTLEFLKERGVKCIELGVQSMSDKVLSAIKRGHTAKDSELASKMILREGFILGHQMMLGLPLSTPDDERFTARRVVELGASQVRIYPVIVMKETELAEEWINKKYVPLDEEEAVKRSAWLILYFGSNGIRVIRCGLHPSPGLLDGSGFLAGPFHPAFRLKAESRIFSLMLEHIISEIPGKVTNVFFNPKNEAAFFGFDRENSEKIRKISAGNIDLAGKNEDVPEGCLMIAVEGKTFILDRGTCYDNYSRWKVAGGI